MLRLKWLFSGHPRVDAIAAARGSLRGPVDVSALRAQARADEEVAIRRR